MNEFSYIGHFATEVSNLVFYAQSTITVISGLLQEKLPTTLAGIQIEQSLS